MWAGDSAEAAIPAEDGSPALGGGGGGFDGVKDQALWAFPHYAYECVRSGRRAELRSMSPLSEGRE
jgi:hypothetical protein